MEYHEKTVNTKDKPQGKNRFIWQYKTWRKLSGEELIRGGVTAFIAFLLGICELPFAVYPLGMAFLCASDTGIWFAAAGLAVSAFVLPFPWWFYLVAIVVTVMIRALTRLFVDIPVRFKDAGGFRGVWEHIHGRFFCESLYLRMTCSCVSVFILSLYTIISGGFRYYDLIGAFLSLIVAPTATFFYSASVVTGQLPIGGKPSVILRKAAKLVLAFTICLSLRGLDVATLSLSAVAAFISTMILCRQEGGLLGGIAGVLCGLSVGVTAIPVYAVAAVTAFCLFEVSMPLATCVAAVAGAVTGMLMNGGTGLTGIFLPLLAGASITCTTDKLLSHGGIAGLFNHTDRNPGCDTMRLDKKYNQTVAELDSLCQSLNTLSETFADISIHRRKPSTGEWKKVCNMAFDGFCQSCSGYRQCRTTRSAVLAETISRMVAAYEKGEAITKEILPSEFTGSCENTDELIQGVNAQASVLIRNTLDSEKAGVCAADFGAVSAVVKNLTDKVSLQYAEDAKRTAAVRDKLRELGFDATQVSVCDERNTRVFVSGLSPIPENKRLIYLQNQLGRALDCVFGLPLLTVNGDMCSLLAERAVVYDVSYGMAFAAKEDVSGDSTGFFEDDRRKMSYALINDGMGTGRDASVTAGISTAFLRQILTGGAEPETALRMLNNFLCLGKSNGNGEISTTVDLLCFDRLTGHAVFLKSGAAPTYVKRGTNIFKLASATLPVGILDLTDAKRIEFEARDGDIFILTSDGVTQGDNECLWLLEYLNNTTVTEPQAIADYIKEAALAHKSRDDVTALVVKIRQKL